ncbi:MAG: PIN domain-containing protein, partial [Candidatus Thiodiazotropha endolucinida]
MSEKRSNNTRLFVLDTNVLMHDPTALFRFKEHDIYLPMVVLEELDKGKKGMSEVARNVRQTSRFLDELMSNVPQSAIYDGIPLDTLQLNGGTESLSGHLFFQTKPISGDLPSTLPGNTPDNTILATALNLQSEYPERKIILVSKDINLRIKAAVVGIHAEDYSNDKVLEDVNLLYSGMESLPAGFWEQHTKELESWQEEGRTFYRIAGPDTEAWYPSQCLHLPGDEGFQAIVRKKEENNATIELMEDFTNPKHAVWGITARNQEQNFALNLLLDPELDFVSLLGTAGTGKTLLTLAAGLVQTLDLNLYREIIMTRVTVPVGEDIGFLPGTEEEKMTPWMGALMDNLEVLTQTEGGEVGR